MEIKVLLCNCKGLCDSFKDSDMNKLPFEVESDLDVKYTVLSPQLCGQGGNAILEEAMKTSKPDGYLLVGACPRRLRRSCSRNSFARPASMRSISFQSISGARTTREFWSGCANLWKGFSRRRNPHPILRHKERDLCCGIGRSAALLAYPRDVNVCASYLYPG